MIQFNITGMSCAACQTRVEKAVSKVEGVTSCSVSLLTNSMGVEGSASAEKIIKAVTDAGYGASLKDNKSNSANSVEDSLKDTITPVLKKRLAASLIFLCMLMYMSMGHMMWNLPLPPFLHDNPVGNGIIQMLLTIIIMVINQRFFISGFKSVIHGAPNMDTLVAMGSGTAFLWSVYALFMMSGVAGDIDKAASYMDEFYFESAAMILTLITIGKMLEARSKGKTTDAVKGLMKLAAKTANVLVDGNEASIPIENVKIGDIFVVRPGENIPVDGIIVEGSSAVNEAALTGESIPVDKGVDDEVSAATLNTSGFIKCRATRVGEDTTLAKIIQMVSDAAATKAPIAKVADKVSGIFVPTVIVIAFITTIIWFLVGKDAGYALARGISVLVISCPCALGLATPVAIMVGNGVGAKNGILFKTAVSLEQTGKMQIVCLDKTGTITRGEPVVTDIIADYNSSEAELLKVAYSLENMSEHPLAKAVVKYVEEHLNKSDIYNVDEFIALSGNGLKGIIVKDGKKLEIYGGKYGFISNIVKVPETIKDKADRLSDMGKTVMYFANNEKLLGAIAVADTIKEDSPEAIEQIKNMGIKVVMITGDNERSAKAVGELAGVDKVIAGVMPEGKAEVVSRLKEHGKVLMVGDGINDALALTMADIGVAIGAGTDVAIDAADVVLMKSRLSDVAAAIRLSSHTLTNIHENLFWAFFYNCIGIPLAAGVWIPIFGWTLNPMFGAAAMSLSSFCVVTNALRLNFVKLYDSGKDSLYKKRHKGYNIELDDIDIINEKEVETMTKTINIEGMMCAHCEATVKKALEMIDGVSEAVVSHDAGTAVVTMTNNVEDAVLTKAVEDKDFKVTSIQ